MSFHPKWLTEEEISNQLAPIIMENSFYEETEIYREYEIGSKRIDFITFNKFYVGIYEVKITASIHTIAQVAFYKNLIKDQIDFYVHENRQDNMSIETSIIARYIDNDIIEPCFALGINLYKLEITDSGEVVDMHLMIDKAQDGVNPHFKTQNIIERINGKKSL